MKRIKLIFLSISFFCVLEVLAQNTTQVQQIESIVGRCVDKALASSVYIIEYDTLRGTVKEGIDEAQGFSGVVVSERGHILTVSHAAVTGEVYQIRFPDGNRVIAKGLGRLGVQSEGTDYDMAMLKIIKAGKWPYAEMGRAADLKVNQLLVGISYPGSFYKQQPNVRLGRVTNPDTKQGFLTSTVKMEPGDSGGPLFDENGRVVGIHSWIEVSEDVNFDVPVDFFLEFWKAMNVAEDYQQVPAKDNLPPFFNRLPQTIIPSLDELVNSFSYTQASVKLTSRKASEEVGVLGTAFSVRDQTYIISKNSMVGNHPRLDFKGNIFKLDVLNRDRENDLILLCTKHQLPIGISLGDVLKQGTQIDIGKILFSDLGSDHRKAGIISAMHVDMPIHWSIGYFGAGAIYNEGRINISEVRPSRDQDFPLKKGDQVLTINGIDVVDADDYNREILKYLAGDSISFDIIREGVPLNLGLYLSGQPDMRHISFEYPGGRSGRCDGFYDVLIQDAAIRPEECGGAVFDRDGKFIGVNIARRSRTSTVVIPSQVLIKYIQKFI